jgi:predicted permease
MSFTFWRRHRRERELDEEIRSHQAMAARDKVERGDTPGDAGAAATREFGNVLRVKEITREMWGWGRLETWWQDLAYGVRVMRRNAGFTIVALVSLALGIGANATMFTVVSSVLLKPLPFRQSDRLVMVYSIGSMGRFTWDDGPLFDPEYLELHRITAFSDVAAFGGGQASLVDASEPVHVKRVEATASLFPLLAVQASRGRVFSEQDQASGASVVVLSDALWRGRYQADPGVIGRVVKIEGVPHTVVGVLPAGLEFPAGTDVWTPLSPRPGYRGNAYNRVIARLSPGASRDQARTEVEALLSILSQGLPDGRHADRVSIVDVRESMVGKVRWLLLVLLGAVGCIILIACTNLANLLMARAGGRAQEMSIRLSIGAGRPRLIRQLLTESVTLAVCGGALGMFLAATALPILLQWVPPDMLPRRGEVRLNWIVFGLTFVLSVVTGLTFGLLPALSASRATASQFRHLRSTRGTPTGDRRLNGLLVVTETALVLVLLVGAGLLLKSFWKLQHVDPGFRSEGLLTMTMLLPDRAYESSEAKREFNVRALERLQARPELGEVAAVNLLPFGLMRWGGDFQAEGADSSAASLIVAKPAVSENYFRTLGIPLKAGRFFESGDREGAPLVTIVSESVARASWPGRDPLGRRILMDDNTRNRWLTVVGVVGDVRQGSLEETPVPAIYVPLRQERRGFFLATMTYVMRPRAGAERVAAAGLREEVRALDPELPILRIARLDEILFMSMAEPRFRTTVLLIFAGLALVLAAVGIYGVVSYEVARRTGEVGIRRALGARSGDVIRLVIGRTAVLVSIGIAVGLAIAGATSRALASFLFAVEPTDAVTFAFVSAALCAVALVAALVPARRALAVDPVVALRYE